MVKTIQHLLTPQASNNHRPKLLQLEGFTLLSILLLVFFAVTKTLSGSPLPSVLGFASSISASQVISDTNNQRLALGLPALIMNSELNQAATAKGNNMCANQYWAHISPSGVTPWSFIKSAGYQYSVAGENLARDFSDTSSMVAAWMASPTHRANMVNSRYKDIGVAVIDCKLLGSDTALVVQMFGSQLTGIPATSPTGATTQISTNGNVPNPSKGLVAGEQSAPKIITEANPVLKLATPPPSANPTQLRVLSTLQVVKAVMVSILLILFFTLFIDLWLTEKRQTVRLVGRNLAHLIFLTGIFLVVLIIKAGVI